jgi:hypothetical protein
MVMDVLYFMGFFYVLEQLEDVEVQIASVIAREYGVFMGGVGAVG